MPWRQFVLIMEGVSVRSARYRKRFKIDWIQLQLIVFQINK
jgi:hypothetical protein